MSHNGQSARPTAPRARPRRESRGSPMRPVRSGPAHRATSRRHFLVGAGLAALGGPAFLTACTRDPGGTTGNPAATGSLQLASPAHPVTWPIQPGNEPIADGLAPEKNATLQVYNYADYVEP